jgi:hypothetical protein
MPQRGMVITVLILLVFSIQLSAQEKTKFEAGVHFTALNHNTSLVTEERLTRLGFGSQFSINFTRHVALDSELNFIPTAPADFSSTTGGRITQGLFGVKAGFHFKKIGIFAKARPGFVSFDRVFTEVFLGPAFESDKVGRLTGPCLDIGGVLEVPISRRWAMRYDIGDTMIWLGNRILVPGQPKLPTLISHGVQFNSGFVYRF